MSASVTRRGFLSASASAAAVGVLAACGYNDMVAQAKEASAAKEASGTQNGQWTATADIVVCGGGGAGLNAAYRALELGASVIVLEKSGFTGGTLQYAEGAFQAAGIQDEFDLDDGSNPVTAQDSVELMTQCWLAMADGDCNEDVIRALVAKAPEAAGWIKSSFNLEFGESAGIRPVPFVPQETIADRILYIVDPTDSAKTIGMGGLPWMDHAAQAVKDAGGQIILNSEAVEFITDGQNGTVTGVRCLDGSTFGATKGVICCTGGIDHNEVFAKHVNPYHYWQMTHGAVNSVAANTGQGILAGMALGAQTGFHGTDNNPASFWIGTNKHMMNIIAVGPRGYRFAREDTTYGFWSRCLYNQIRQEGGQDGTVWIIFGEDNFDDNPALQDESAVEGWYKDGTLVKGKDVAELAAGTGLPAEALEQTLAEWQDCCAKKQDLRFGREAAFDGIEAPYFAMKLIMVTTGAFGGLMIDPQCHVIDMYGKPIPHLFAAGNCSAGWLGDFYYGSGTCLTACAVLGMISAENAVGGIYDSETRMPDVLGRSSGA